MKFRTKLILCMIWLLALLYGIGGSLMIASSFASSLEQEKSRARQSCQMLLSTLSIANSYREVVDTLYLLDSREWVGLQVYSNDALLYTDGETVLLQVTDILHVDNQRISIACEAGSGLTKLNLTVTYDISPIYARRDSQLRVYRFSFLAVSLASVVLSAILSHWMMVPLRRLTAGARALAAGNLDKRVPVATQDEIGHLTTEFNTMADKLEQNLNDLRTAMERQEEFMGSFAHELKTPMTSIIGYADLLRSQDLPEGDRRDAANYIFSEGKRLEALSLKLLELLVLEQDSLPLQEVSPRLLSEEIAQEFRPLLQKEQIALTCRGQDGTCLLEPDLFKSLVYNLMDNARKAMDHGGKILIHTEILPNRSCRLLVVDNGRGMPPDALQRITEAFYRVDKSRSRAQGGAGLGLSLCQRIVAFHHGTIQFQSREGIGTQVTVLLPGREEADHA